MNLSTIKDSPQKLGNGRIDKTPAFFDYEDDIATKGSDQFDEGENFIENSRNIVVRALPQI